MVGSAPRGLLALDVAVGWTGNAAPAETGDCCDVAGAAVDVEAVLGVRFAGTFAVPVGTK
jgi:hypothetical protein